MGIEICVSVCKCQPESVLKFDESYMKNKQRKEKKRTILKSVGSHREVPLEYKVDARMTRF